jgi:hypothetical protein
MERMGLDRYFKAFFFVLFSVAQVVHSQNLRGTMITGFGDIATIKQKAEAGDARAQVALGDSLSANFYSLEALDWYRKAADQKDTEGAYHAGHLLLFGGVGIPKEQTVKPNPSEGIRWTFQAATNLDPNALHDMSRAYQQGLGVSSNAIQAYAWQQLYAETSPGSAVGKVELNQMALKLDTATIQQAQQLAAEFKQLRWSQPTSRALPNETNLKVSSIVLGRPRLTVINGKTFEEGESGKVVMNPRGSVAIHCLKIEKDFVVLSVEGEDTPRRLTLK